MCTGFSFCCRFLVFHRWVNDATTSSSSIRLWYPISFRKVGLVSNIDLFMLLREVELLREVKLLLLLRVLLSRWGFDLLLLLFSWGEGRQLASKDIRGTSKGDNRRSNPHRE